jgi:hypothetical protein
MIIEFLKFNFKFDFIDKISIHFLKINNYYSYFILYLNCLDLKKNFHKIYLLF